MASKISFFTMILLLLSVSLVERMGALFRTVPKCWICLIERFESWIGACIRRLYSEYVAQLLGFLPAIICKCFGTIAATSFK